MVEYFKFENHDEDLLFYHGKMEFSINGAVLLFLCLLLFMLPIALSIPRGDFEFSLYLRVLWFLTFKIYSICVYFAYNFLNS